jgi:hypothetical protein
MSEIIRILARGLRKQEFLYVAYSFLYIKFKLYYDRRSVGQSVLVSGTPFGPATNFSSFLELVLDGFWFNYVGCLLWREIRSVVLNSVQFIDSIFETPPTWRVMFLYLFPQEQGSSAVYCPFFLTLSLAIRITQIL